MLRKMKFLYLVIAFFSLMMIAPNWAQPSRAALQQGYTEQQILESFVAVYGERILAKPKAVGFNLLAWILPAIAILLGGIGAWKFLRHSSRPQAETKSAKPAPSDDPYAQRVEHELEEFDK